MVPRVVTVGEEVYKYPSPSDAVTSFAICAHEVLLKFLERESLRCLFKCSSVSSNIQRLCDGSPFDNGHSQGQGGRGAGGEG
ncbi:unnamed protein product, partial [Cuscuta europaea]